MMTSFKKYKEGYEIVACPLYDGCYDLCQFKMIYKDRFWFDLEVRGFDLLKEKPYIPKLLSIDSDNRTIIFDWVNSKSIDHMIHFNDNLPLNCYEQIKNIILDLEKSGLYKFNLYPWTFYVKNSKVYIMDLYGCLPADEPVYKKDVYHILNDKKRFVFNNEVLDIPKTYEYTLKHNVKPWLEKIKNG